MNMLASVIKNQISSLKEQIATIDSFLNHCPEGKLYYAQRNHRVDYRVGIKTKTGWVVKYISKSDPRLILLYKKQYYTRLRDVLSRNVRVCSYFLKHYYFDPNEAVGQQLRTCQQPLFNKYFKTNAEKIKAWQAEPYNQNPYKSEERNITTLSGALVRSKSEREIANALYRNGIPFRTDCEVVCEGGVIYADFIILHPRTLELYYWEHYGMLDDPKYNAHNNDRIAKYANQGIIIGDRLIITGETSQNVLETKIIEETIARFLV